MRELHVVAVSEDGTHVVLATTPDAASGEFHVALDQRLTSAVRGELPRPDGGTVPTISPREIQARLRDGESPEQIATAAGVPLSRVERFAGPVLAELDRILDGARAAIVHRPRLGPSDVPLGEAVELSLADVTGFVPESVRWSARREDAGRWVVQLSWSARGRRRTAGWRFDPSRRELTPVDAASANLGHVEDAAAARATAAAAAAAAAADAAAGPGRRRTVRPAPGGVGRTSGQDQTTAGRRTSPRAATRAATKTEAGTAAPTAEVQRARPGAATSDGGPAAPARAASRRTTRAAVPRVTAATPTPATTTPARKEAPKPATTGTAKPPRRRAAVPPVAPAERSSARRAAAPGQSRDAQGSDVPSKEADRDRGTAGRESPTEPVPARPPLLRVVPAEPVPDEAGRDEAGRDEAGRDEAGRDEARRDEPGHDGPDRDEPGRDEPGHDGPGRDEPRCDDERRVAGRARAGGRGSGAPDWADVLMGAAPGPPRDGRRGE